MGEVRIINSYDRREKGISKVLSLETVIKVMPPSVVTQVKNITIKRMIKHLETRYGLFSDVEIETINRCNNTCSFCPANALVDKRPFARMDESLFRRIVDELAGLRYSALLGMHSNNEPYMDKHIIARIAYARQKCPNAYIYMYTNGMLLNTKKLLQSIDAGLSSIVVNNYNDDLVLNDNIKAIVEDLEKRECEQYLPRIHVCIRKKTEVLANRGGIAPNKTVAEHKKYMTCRDIACINPFRQFVIRPTGEVSLCCQDVFGQITLGDVRKQNLKDIWDGPKFREIRSELLKNGRKNLRLCCVCDVASVDHHTLIMLTREKIRKVIPSTLLGS